MASKVTYQIMEAIEDSSGEFLEYKSRGASFENPQSIINYGSATWGGRGGIYVWKNCCCGDDCCCDDRQWTLEDFEVDFESGLLIG